MKTCTICNKPKPDSDFYRDLRPGRRGTRNECKSCKRENSRYYRQQRREIELMRREGNEQTPR